MTKDFIFTLKDLAKEIHETAVEKGWWEKERNDGEMLALAHSEISEAYDAVLKGIQQDDKVPEYTGLEAELADTMIRILDQAYAREWNFEGPLSKLVSGYEEIRGEWPSAIQLTIHNYKIDHIQAIAEFHKDVSDILESLRHGSKKHEFLIEYTTTEVTVACLLMDILMYCYSSRLRIEEVIHAKMAMNKTRSYKHGGKEF